MYNFTLAFTICAAAYVIGEWVSKLTKAWVPSVFVTAIVLLLGYWTVLPTTLVSDSNLIPFGSTLAVYLLITHLGTIISFEQLKEQWKTIVICLAGLAGMCALSLFVAPLFIDKSFVIAGLPPLTGGIIAASIMQQASLEAGFEAAALFAIAMYCVQGFAGYPLTSVCLQYEGKRLLKGLRSGEIVITPEERLQMESAGVNEVADDSDVKTLFPKIPDKWNSPVLMLGKLSLVAWVASQIGELTGISGMIWALILGVIFTKLGFLETNIVNRCNSFTILMFALMMFVFDGLKTCTPAMLKSIMGPMVVLIVTGLIGMALASFVIAKVLKVSFPMAFANGLTALYGFPCNAIITESTCEALAETEEERKYLVSKMLPSMIVGGFITVTLTSVFIAGLFVKLL